MNGYLAIMKSDGVAEVRRAALKVSYGRSPHLRFRVYCGTILINLTLGNRSQF